MLVVLAARFCYNADEDVCPAFMMLARGREASAVPALGPSHREMHAKHLRTPLPPLASKQAGSALVLRMASRSAVEARDPLLSCAVHFVLPAMASLASSLGVSISEGQCSGQGAGLQAAGLRA